MQRRVPSSPATYGPTLALFTVATSDRLRDQGNDGLVHTINIDIYSTVRKVLLPWVAWVCLVALLAKDRMKVRVLGCPVALAGGMRHGAPRAKEEEEEEKASSASQVVLVLDHREQFGRAAGAAGGRLEMHAEAAAQLRNLGVTVDVRRRPGTWSFCCLECAEAGS